MAHAALGVLLAGLLLTANGNTNLTIRMPGALPSHSDTYVCTVMNLDPVAQPRAIVGFDFMPSLVNGVHGVHHVLVFGCSDHINWSEPHYDCFDPCGFGEPRIMWGWALDASAFKLPKGVGYPLDEGIKSISLQIHFMEKATVPDYSAVAMTLSQQPVQLRAGVMIAAPSEFEVPGRHARFPVRSECCYTGSAPLLGFAFRVHAHTLGRQIKLERLRRVAGSDAWESYVLGNRSAQLPQQYSMLPTTPAVPERAFSPQRSMDTSPRCAAAYHKFNPTGLVGDGCPAEGLRLADSDGSLVALQTILPGDVLRVTCIYDSSQRERTTFVGWQLVSNRLAVSYCRWQHTNEMCNFYVMYAVDLINPTFECLEIDELGEDEDSSEDSDASNNSDEDHSNDSDWNTHSDEDQSNDNDSVDAAPHSDLSSTVQTEWPASAGYIGQVGGLDVDNEQDLLYIFHRGVRTWGANSFTENEEITEKAPIAEATVLVLDVKTHETKNSWGADTFFMPHGITVAGSDVWLTDVGLHQVFKFSTRGQLLLTLGSRLKPGNDRQHFCKPTSVAVQEGSGAVFVADGYCNSRIVRFDAEGEYIYEWFLKGRGISNGILQGLAYNQFSVPHSLAWSECGTLRVADRENEAIHSYTPDGSYQWTWSSASSDCTVYALATDPSGCEGEKLFAAAWCPTTGVVTSIDLLSEAVTQYISSEDLKPHAIAISASIDNGQLTRVLWVGGIASSSRRLAKITLPRVSKFDAKSKRCLVKEAYSAAVPWGELAMPMEQATSPTKNPTSSYHTDQIPTSDPPSIPTETPTIATNDNAKHPSNIESSRNFQTAEYETANLSNSESGNYNRTSEEVTLIVVVSILTFLVCMLCIWRVSWYTKIAPANVEKMRLIN